MLPWWCGTEGFAEDCTREQKKELEEFFKGRRVTAKIDLPLVSFPGGLWVFWNGEYDLETYADSFKRGPASILRGQSSTIKDIRIRGREILYGVGGRGLAAHWKGPYNKTPQEAYRHGSLVSVTFGRRLTASDCSIENNIRALSGVLEIAGVEVPEPYAAAPVDSVVAGTQPDADPARTLSGEPGFELIGVAVEPTRARAGESIRLVTHLKVSGGSPVEITESRQIYFEGRALFSRPRATTSSWTAGVHRSELEFELPTVAGPGVYRYEVVVEALGGRHTDDALFEIR